MLMDWMMEKVTITKSTGYPNIEREKVKKKWKFLQTGNTNWKNEIHFYKDKSKFLN